METKYILFHF